MVERNVVIELVNSLNKVLDIKEGRKSYTSQHQFRVGNYARKIGEKICYGNYEEGTLDILEFGGSSHDVGKIFIPNNVILTPRKLKSYQYGQIRSHTVKGAALLEEFGFPREIVEVAEHHHENYDGTGYPSKLIGAEIPIAARIVRVADFYDSFGRERPYKKPYKKENIIKKLEKGRGSLFDPEIVEVFLKTI